MEVLKLEQKTEDDSSHDVTCKSSHLNQTLSVAKENYPIPPITATITGFKEKKSFFSNCYFYVISVNSSNENFGVFENKVIERRFTHFQDLFMRLNEEFGEVTSIPCPPSKIMPQFKDSEANRKVWLQTFIDMLLLNPDLSESRLVIEFFTLPEGPELIKKNFSGMISDNVGKISEKINAIKYADVDSDEWYLFAKNQIASLDRCFRKILKSLTSSSALILNSFESTVFERKCEYFAQTCNAVNQIARELSPHEDAARDSLDSLANILAVTASANSRFSAQNIRGDNVYTTDTTYEAVFSDFIVKLGSLKLIFRMFLNTFERREKLYRPIFDLDSEIKELKLQEALSENEHGYKLEGLTNEMNAKTERVKNLREKFDDFSSSQKVVLDIYKRFTFKFVISNLKELLKNILEIEKKKLESYQRVKQML